MGRWATVVLALVLLACGGRSAAGQNPDYTLDLTDALGVLGGSATTFTVLDDPLGEPLAGWSWGVCHNGPVDILTVFDGSAILTINDGGPPDFNAVSIFPGVGWTVGVVVDFFGQFLLPPGTGLELHQASYDLLAEGTAGLAYCDSLGMPAVGIVLVTGNGANILPTTSTGTITVEGTIAFLFEAPDTVASYDPVDGTGFFMASPTIAENPDSPIFPSEVQGFAMGLTHDPALIIPTNVEPAPALQALNGGTGPDFFGVSINPDGDVGWTVGVVFDFFGQVTLVFADETEVVDVSYITVAGSLAGNDVGTSTDLVWSDQIGDIPVVNTVVVDSNSIMPALLDGTVTLVPFLDTPFVRGDCNGDGEVNIADGVFILNHLFQGGATPECNEACDANGDSQHDQSDAVYVFNYRFLAGPLPPAPFPGCGVVAMGDCGEYVACP